MPALPPYPNLDQLRHQARDLLSAARSGDAAASRRMQTASQRRTLAAAQLAIAREYGFASWAKLKAQVEMRAMDLDAKAQAFCEASIRDWTGLAARMLAATPEIAGHSFATAVVLGDLARVRREIERDPGLVNRPDARWGWMPLHVVCASRWHQLDPARAGGLVETALLLLDSGADMNARTSGRRRQSNAWSPLRCAVAGAANPRIARLLLERGAVPDDGDLYLAGFADDDHQCLRMLLEHMPNVAAVAEMALAAPISRGDVEGVRLLLDAGADPRRFRSDNRQPRSAVSAALEAGCAAELIELLLAHGADVNAPGPDGRPPYRLATSQGRGDAAQLLRRYGADERLTETDRFLSACLRNDRSEAENVMKDHPDVIARLSQGDKAILAQATETGNTAAVGLLLDLGFPIDSAAGDDGRTLLHAAAYSGSAGTVRLLLERGADIEARDTTWDGTPLQWAMVGSGESPRRNPTPDWVATVRTLIDAGAVTAGITLSPDDPKPPSREIAELLRAYGVGDEHRGSRASPSQSSQEIQ